VYLRLNSAELCRWIFFGGRQGREGKGKDGGREDVCWVLWHWDCYGGNVAHLCDHSGTL